MATNELPDLLPPPIGEKHYLIPSFAAARSQSITRVSDRNGTVIDESGLDNAIISNGDVRFDIRFISKGTRSNKVFLNDTGKYVGKIFVSGTENVIIICGESPWPSRISLYVDGNRSFLFLARKCTFVNTEMFLTGDDVSIICGEDCMFSHATMVRTYDQHAIIGLENGDWINKPRSVLIGPHVWIGQETVVLKGVNIGGGSVVGARSLATIDIPPLALAVGSPAKAVKIQVSWMRDRVPNDSQVLALKNVAETFDI